MQKHYEELQTPKLKKRGRNLKMTGGQVFYKRKGYMLIGSLIQRKKTHNKIMIQNNVLGNQVLNKSILVIKEFYLNSQVQAHIIMVSVLVITTCKYSHIGLPNKENML